MFDWKIILTNQMVFTGKAMHFIIIPASRGVFPTWAIHVPGVVFPSTVLLFKYYLIAKHGRKKKNPD